MLRLAHEWWSGRATQVRQALASAGATPQRAIRWLTTVVGVKQLPHGSCVGYECAARTGGGPVALLPLGSHDGFLEPSAGWLSLPTTPAARVASDLSAL